MELVEGRTLQGPLPLETALNYARQIADALEAAHEKDIIHRDLKPANIMITPAGVVKVLDFGLAAVAQSSDPSNPANSPTLTISPTRAGMILGTAAYMSPEQARGKAVDKRADIWAFGVVLYEMLTGKQLFEGETVSDTLAQVLTKEPDWEQVPAKVRRLLEACLQKDPKAAAASHWRLAASARGRASHHKRQLTARAERELRLGSRRRRRCRARSDSRNRLVASKRPCRSLDQIQHGAGPSSGERLRLPYRRHNRGNRPVGHVSHNFPGRYAGRVTDRRSNNSPVPPRQPSSGRKPVHADPRYRASGIPLLLSGWPMDRLFGGRQTPEDSNPGRCSGCPL